MTTGLQKASLTTETDTKIECLFNPDSISMSMSNRWMTPPITPGTDVPTVLFGGSDSGKFSLKLTLDTTATGQPVTTLTSPLMGLMEIDEKLPNTDPDRKNARPPWVMFNWGDLHSFKAVVTSLSLRFSYFSAAGVPLRAEADLGMTQYESGKAFGRQNPTSGTPRPHRVHRLQPGETLDRLAARYYGDPTCWRRLAVANGIGDPLALRPGALLAVPTGEDT